MKKYMMTVCSALLAGQIMVAPLVHAEETTTAPTATQMPAENNEGITAANRWQAIPITIHAKVIYQDADGNVVDLKGSPQFTLALDGDVLEDKGGIIKDGEHTLEVAMPGKYTLHIFQQNPDINESETHHIHQDEQSSYQIEFDVVDSIGDGHLTIEDPEALEKALSDITFKNVVEMKDSVTAPVTTSTTTDSHSTESSEVPSQKAEESSVVTVESVKQKKDQLPDTGESSNTLLYVVGGVVLIIAAVLLLRRRK